MKLASIATCLRRAGLVLVLGLLAIGFVPTAEAQAPAQPNTR